MIIKLLLCLLILNLSYASIENDIKKTINHPFLSSVFVAMAQQESNLRPHITGKHGEIGLFQILPSTIKMMNCKGDMYNSIDNTRCALKYFKYLRKKFISLERTLRAYNAGEGYCSRHEYIGEWSEHPYVGKILKNIEINYNRSFH